MPRPTRSIRLTVFAGLIVLSATGCHWDRFFRRNLTEPPPLAFAAHPSQDEALTAINANSARIQTLQSEGATVSVPGAPSIGAEIALARPQSLRFRAGTTLLGPELDLGSNDQLFWFWAARAPEPALFYARHDQFAASRAQQMFPIAPSWLIEALGVVQVDPVTVIEGPIASGQDRAQIKTTMTDGGRQYTRLLQIHDRYGWVLEQHLFDDGGQRVATARLSQHEYYPLDGVSLPKRIEVEMPQGRMQFQVDVARWIVNQLPTESQNLFELPRAQLSNYPLVDLADPSFAPPAAGAPVPASPRVSATPEQNLQGRYRGLSGPRY